MLLPVAGIKWSDTTLETNVPSSPSQARAIAEKSSFSTLEPVRARWDGIPDPEAGDYVGIYPAGDRGATRRAFVETRGAAQGTAEMGPLFEPGVFELRIFRAGGWELLGVSMPFEVVRVMGSLHIEPSSAVPGSAITARWNGLNYPNADDWIGVFPQMSTEVIPSTKTNTHGRPSGQTSISIPDNTPPGDYEVRLYTTRGWKLLSNLHLNIAAR